jgi:lysophospholipase L1-like esterase
MRLSKWLWVGVLTLAMPWLAMPSLASAATYVLGDSIGDGMAVTMGINNLAQIGIHIRGPKALAQIARTPPGSTIYIFLGTNDAEDNLKNIEKSIDAVVDAAAQRQLTVIWVGPHCVRKSWDANDRKLDEILSAELAKTSVKYISTRGDQTICSGKFHEPDGVHLTAKGYRYMWTMVQNAVDAPATASTAVASASPTPVAGDATAVTSSINARHRLVMEIHVPGSPSAPLLWTKAQN